MTPASAQECCALLNETVKCKAACARPFFPKYFLRTVRAWRVQPGTAAMLVLYARESPVYLVDACLNEFQTPLPPLYHSSAERQCYATCLKITSKCSPRRCLPE
jgi:hypothetical protein